MTTGPLQDPKAGAGSLTVKRWPTSTVRIAGADVALAVPATL
ncbi:MAG: hypothetical protein ABSF33_06805 [Acidimicrobiales bacterium]|jgi:hypothetical protein